MPDFDYSSSELEMNRVLKMQQDHLKDVTAQVNNNSAELDDLQARLDAIVKKRNINLPEVLEEATSEIDTPEEYALANVADTVDWDSLVKKSMEKYDLNPVKIEHLLSSKEIRYGMDEIDQINKSFSSNTGLTAKDLAFLATATSLQSARWFILQKMFTVAAKGASAAVKGATGAKAIGTTATTAAKSLPSTAKSVVSSAMKVQSIIGGAQTFGQLISKSKDLVVRRNENASTPDAQQTEQLEAKATRTWRDMIMQCAPYDLDTTGDISKIFGVGIDDFTRTPLGKDSMWSYIIGAINYLIDTVTFDNYNTYRVTRDPELRITEKISMKQMFKDAIDAVNEDIMKLPIAVYAQMMHQQGKTLTDAEFLSTFAEQRISTLYTHQYEMFTKSKKLLLIGDQAMIASLINMTIGLYHTLQYDPKKDGTFEQYETRTRTILSMSNAMSSATNALFTVSTQNWFALDAGGMMIAFNRFMNDVQFTSRLKDDMIKQKLEGTFQLEENPTSAIMRQQDSGLPSVL